LRALLRKVRIVKSPERTSRKFRNFRLQIMKKCMYKEATTFFSFTQTATNYS
jgi:hypothetical protein